MNEFETVDFRRLPHILALVTNISHRAMHVHNETELLLCLRGSCEIALRRGIVRVDRGGVVIVDRAEPHSIESEEGADLLVVQFSRHLLGDYFPTLRTTSFESGPAENPEKLAGTLLSLGRSYFSDDELFELKIIKNCAEMLDLLFKNVPHSVLSERRYLDRKRADKRIADIAAYAREHFDGKISLRELSRREGVTEVHLSHFIRENFGMTFQDYVANLRLESAVRLLAESRLSVTDAAAASGYSDPKYMTRAFRDRFGMTPLEFRKSASSQREKEKGSASERRFGREESLMMVMRYGETE